jgi:hypothetical protein
MKHIYLMMSDTGQRRPNALAMRRFNVSDRERDNSVAPS